VNFVLSVAAEDARMEMVNGYRCKDCTDVELAKRHIDPAHPKDGPYGVNAKNRADAPARADERSVVFGGILNKLNQTQDGRPADPIRASPTPDKTTGPILDMTA
jgi:hypothetical protein